MRKIFIFLFAVCYALAAHAQTWQPVGGDILGNDIHGFGIWNNQLVTGGSFNNNPCDKIATFDSLNWSCLAGGIGTVVRAVTSWNGNLVAVGDFWNNSQPCTNCNGVAMWNGTNWTNLGTGFNNDVLCITVWNGNLVAGGDFTTADGNTCYRVAMWNGTGWEAIGGLDTVFNNDVRALAVYNGELWAGGDFSNANGCTACDRIVKWNGTAWVGGNSGVDIPGGLDSTVRVLYVDQAANRLYMGGHFIEVAGNTNSKGIAFYNGSAWSSLGTGVNSYVRAITKYNGNIIIGGDFTTAGAVAASKVAKWDPVSGTWNAMDSGFNDYLRALIPYKGELYAGGAFTLSGSSPRSYIAKWYEPPTSPPAASFTPSSATICAGQCISFTDNSSNSPTSWSWSFPGATPGSSTASNPSNVCYAAAGTYTVTLTATNANGSNTATQIITVTNAPAANAGADVSICEGASATLTASGGTTYSWSPSTGLNTTTGATVIATPSVTTTYTVTVSNAGSCTAIDVVTVTVNPLPPVSAAGGGTICAGTSSLLTATGADIYQWMPGSLAGSSVTVTPTTSTTYTVTGTASNGCSNTAIISLTVNPSPPVTVTGTTAICSGDQVMLTATGANAYSWMPGSYTGSTITDTPSSTTTYTITGTDSNGCTGTTTVTVTVNPLPSITATAQNSFICSGSSTTLLASGGDTYTWMPGSYTGVAVTVTPSVTTTYTVAGTSASGCSNTAVVSVAVNPTPVVSAAGDTTVCAGDAALLSASGASTYSWMPGSLVGTSVNVNPTATTTYTVTGTATNGCTNYATVTVIANPLPLVTATGSASCSGNPATAVASGAASYTWMPGSLTGNSVTVTPSATTTYTVTGVDTNGCSNTATATVTVSTIPVIAISGPPTVCSNASATLSATGANAYNWMPGSITGAVVSVNPSASTTYTVTGTDASGCSDTATINLTVNPAPTATVSPNDTICNGESLILNATGGITYSWSPVTALSCTSCPSPTANPATTTSYSVTVADANGCQDTVITTVTVDPCTGLETIEDKNIKIYPNPLSSSLLTIELNAGGIKEFTLYDARGRTVRIINTSASVIQMERGDLENGIYFWKITNEGSTLGKGKLVIE